MGMILGKLNTNCLFISSILRNWLCHDGSYSGTEVPTSSKSTILSSTCQDCVASGQFEQQQPTYQSKNWAKWQCLLSIAWGVSGINRTITQQSMCLLEKILRRYHASLRLAGSFLFEPALLAAIGQPEERAADHSITRLEVNETRTSRGKAVFYEQC
jgi:hypothetical protein